MAQSDDLTALILEQMERTKTYRRVYPVIEGDSVVLRYINGYLHYPRSPTVSWTCSTTSCAASRHAIPRCTA